MNHFPAHKVIFDTDPGVDDAMALYFALAHPAIELVGITTTFGNVSVAQATRNALYLTAIAGRPIPVSQGAAQPVCKAAELPPAHIHGADGLGNLPTRAHVANSPDPRSAAQFIVDMARAQPGDITLVAVGPLGNLSRALELEPGLPGLVREVIIMGGTVTEPGNVSPVAEANIWNDPHAAGPVFSARWKKLTMVGLDVTHRVILPLALFREIDGHHRHLATDTLHHAVGFYTGHYSGLYPHVAEVQGCFAHDVLAFLYLVNPELFTLEPGHIRVVTEGPAQGQTVMTRTAGDNAAQPVRQTSQPVTQVCMQVQAQACGTVFRNVMLGPWLTR